MKKLYLPAGISLIAICAGLSMAQINVNNNRNNQPWASEITLAAADTTKTLMAAPSGIFTTIYVQDVNCEVLTAAAPITNIESVGNQVQVLRIPASATGAWSTHLANGIALQSGSQLRIQPTSAGPAVHCSASGYVR